MKRIGFLLFITLIHCSVSMAQNSIVNIDFNISIQENRIKKYLDSDKCAHFYIGREHFKAMGPAETIALGDLNLIALMDLDKFVEVSDSRRERLIKKGEKEGIIKLLSNSEVFDTIYLYEKSEENKALKYRVIWIDEIID